MPSTVKKGSTGSDVVLCQERLVLWGYPCSIDGIFGAETDTQVRSFQSQHGLVADGIVGNATWNVLLSTPTTTGAPSYEELDDLSRRMMVEIAWFNGWDYTPKTPSAKSLVAQPSRLAPMEVVWAPGSKTDTDCCTFIGGVNGRVYDKVARWTANAWKRVTVQSRAEPWSMINEFVEAGIAVPYSGTPKDDAWYVAQGWNNLENGHAVDASTGHQWFQWGPDLIIEATTYTDEDANGASDDPGQVAWRRGRTWEQQKSRYQEVRLVELVKI